MAIFLAGKAVCYRILAFFCYGKLHFKCESADLFTLCMTKNLPESSGRFAYG